MAVIIGAYDIRYIPRTILKAQVLTYFIAELTPVPKREEKLKEQWNVWVDKTSSSSGVGIGVVLEGSPKAKLKYAAKLAFRTTNNVTKYKAILMALRIFKEVRALKANIYCDSQLAVNQLQGNFQVRDQNLRRYELWIQNMLAEIQTDVET
ncbi:hypothetical protein P3X46_013905 [Hevea brasiliensis]|uniref:RNase H type-1 domain-containing protein n=1 Tax=Hevea brasiliensis TaxID=3981 RepID=A0ABQ9M7C9_HEVBR|nr:hypothetical protein P3X46_013905 [Hevea brasiliensis]